MNWNPFRKRVTAEVKPDGNHNKELEQELKTVEEKLAADQAKTKDLAKATASARRVHYRVDQFTEEYSRSFGRTNHG
jgi:phage terminase Nu1 subunit (DNA packaging protein)